MLAMRASQQHPRGLPGAHARHHRPVRLGRTRRRAGPGPPAMGVHGRADSRGPSRLVVTGMSARHAQDLLNDVAAHVLHADAPRPGEQVPLIGGPLIEIVEVAEPSAHLLTAVEFYGPEIRALQLVHADDRGHWPWEVGFRGVRGGQPVLGVSLTR